jgi:hypothetical protein
VTTQVEAQENTESIDKAVNDVTPVINEASLECVVTKNNPIKPH